MWKVTKRSPILKQTKAASLFKLVFVKVGMTLQWTPDVKRLMLAGHKIKWVKVFKSGPNKVCKGSLPQILLGP